MKKDIKKNNFLRTVMKNLNVGDEFISRGVESSKISSIRIGERKFKTTKMIILNPVVKDSLTGEFEVCYSIERIE